MYSPSELLTSEFQDYRLEGRVKILLLSDIPDDGDVDSVPEESVSASNAGIWNGIDRLASSLDTSSS